MNGNNSEILQELQKISRLLALSYVKEMPQKEAIVTLAAAKFTNSDISRLLGVPVGSVSGTIARARQAGRLK